MAENERGGGTRWFIGHHPTEDSTPHLRTHREPEKPEFVYYEYVPASKLDHAHEIIANAMASYDVEGNEDHATISVSQAAIWLSNMERNGGSRD